MNGLLSMCTPPSQGRCRLATVHELQRSWGWDGIPCVVLTCVNEQVQRSQRIGFAVQSRIINTHVGLASSVLNGFHRPPAVRT
jgi:hypothetical protein